MATKKTTTVPEPLAPVGASTAAASLVVNKPKKVTVKKKTATKKPAAKKPAMKKVTAVKQPTAKKPVVSTVKKSAAKATKKKPAKKKSTTAPVLNTTQEPVVAVERVTVFSEDLQPRGRFTLVHVGELYLVSIFFALVILGITYWAVALSNTVQWAQTLTSSSEYVVEHVMRLALL